MTPPFLSTPGDVAELLRRHDWSGTDLGPPASWPQPLQTLVALVLRATTAMYVAWGPRSEVIYNDAYAAILGGRHPQALGRPMSQVWPDLWARIEPLYARTFAGEPVSFDNGGATTLRHGMLEPSTYHVAYTPVFDGTRVAGLFCVLQDITPQAMVERKLRIATEGSGMGTWELDLVSGRGLWSEGGAQMMGSGRREFNADDWAEAIHPDDRAAALAAWRNAVDHGGLYAIEFRTGARAEDGGERWLLSRGRIERDEAGRPLRAAGVMFDVTSRARAQKALAEQRARERAYLDHLPIGVWFLGPGGRVEFGNAEGLRIWGAPAPAAPDEFAPVQGWWHASGKPLHPHDWASVRAIRNGESSINEEIDIACLDGTRKTILNSAVPVLGEGGAVVGAVVLNQDISEAKRIEAGMRRTQDELRAAQERMQLAMAIADAATWDTDLLTGRLHWSRSHFELLGHQPAPGGMASWSLWHDAVPPEDMQRIQAERSRAQAAHDVYRAEHRLRRVDGTLLWVSAAGRFFYDGEDRPVRFVGVLFDITQRKLAEQALHTADRRKDEFLATLAHELRNPLAPMRNGLAILRLPDIEPGTQVRMLDLMERQVQHMVRLVDDLLEVSRITRGKIELRREPVELRELVRACLETAHDQFDAAAQRVDTELPAHAVVVHADATRIAQVLDNLLNNASKYTPEGGHIRVTLDDRDGQAVLAVEDDGTGIPPEMLDRVFELFTQVDRTLGRARGGLGIGLALVRQLVQMHGGTVAAESRGIGAGAKLTVRLPLLESPALEAGAARGAALPAAARSQRVLVVDDNRDAADSLAIVLQAGGHQVRTAYGGDEALATAAAFRPDWVMLDIGMPDMDGHEVARRLRQRPGGEHLRLVAVTGWGQEEDRRQTLAAGFDTHMVKPVEPDALLRLVDSAPAAPLGPPPGAAAADALGPDGRGIGRGRDGGGGDRHGVRG